MTSTVKTTVLDTPIGPVALYATDDALVRIRLPPSQVRLRRAAVGSAPRQQRCWTPAGSARSESCDDPAARDWPEPAALNRPSPLADLASPSGAAGDAADPATGAEPIENAAEHPVLGRAAAALSRYFAGEDIAFDLPLDPGGTPFQRTVWRALAEIPFGERRTYRDIAVAIGRPTAVRAVGAANGRNPLPIVVPCHRVVGSNGTLVGFAGGLRTKAWLLDHEAPLLRPHRT